MTEGSHASKKFAERAPDRPRSVFGVRGAAEGPPCTAAAGRRRRHRNWWASAARQAEGRRDQAGAQARGSRSRGGPWCSPQARRAPRDRGALTDLEGATVVGHGGVPGPVQPVEQYRAAEGRVDREAGPWPSSAAPRTSTPAPGVIRGPAAGTSRRSAPAGRRPEHGVPARAGRMPWRGTVPGPSPRCRYRRRRRPVPGIRDLLPHPANHHRLHQGAVVVDRQARLNRCSRSRCTGHGLVPAAERCCRRSAAGLGRPGLVSVRRRELVDRAPVGAGHLARRAEVADLPRSMAWVTGCGPSRGQPPAPG